MTHHASSISGTGRVFGHQVVVCVEESEPHTGKGFTNASRIHRNAANDAGTELADVELRVRRLRTEPTGVEDCWINLERAR
jgi:hypothetical protein